MVARVFWIVARWCLWCFSSLSVGHYELCRDDIGVLWKGPQAEPRHNIVAYRCWQASAWQTNAMQEVATFQPPQRKFTNIGARRDHWVPKGNQAIRTPSPVQGLTGDPGKLTPVLGLASDCSAQSDCRGSLEDSTRVHRPENWTGGEKGACIPRWGGMAWQAWHRPVLSFHYLLLNTREETGSTQRL